MIRVVYRHRVDPGTEDAFMEAWERCKKKMLARAHGSLGASLLRSRKDPTEFVTVTRWESEEDWRTYWSGGVPDPEGELGGNEILVELRSVDREESEQVSPAKPRKR